MIQLVSDRKPSPSGKGRIIRPENAAPRYLEAMVPVRFRKEVIGHSALLLASLREPELANAPVFLMIEGAPGTGKTFQAIAACVQCGLTAVYCSMSDLTGGELSDSANEFSALYEQALGLLESGEYPVIILDDFHKGEAFVLSGVKTTVNTGLLTGRLMNVCDDPSITKVPIVATANSFKGVDGALLRDGRSRFFYWAPTAGEKADIVVEMYQRFMPREDARNLVAAHPDLDVASFAAAIEESRINAVLNALESGLSVRDVVLFPGQYGLANAVDVAGIALSLKAMETRNAAR